MMPLYNEIDPFAVEWLRRLMAAGELPQGFVDPRSIRELQDAPATSHFFAGIGGWPLALKQAGWPDSAPVWTGSCPCQPFSAAGKGKGFDDERHLWPEFFRLIAKCRPPIVFGEQVAGAAGYRWLDLVQADLAGEGYTCGAADLAAASVGSPQIRQRLYWVACADEFLGRQGGSLRSGGNHRGDAQPRPGPGGGIGLGGMAAAQCEGLQGSKERDAARQAFPGAGASGLEGRVVGTYGSIGHQGSQIGSWRNHRGSPKSRPGLGGAGEPVGLGHPGSLGTRGHTGTVLGPEGKSSDERFGIRRLPHGAIPPGATGSGFWREVDWLYCRDEKIRPVELGTLPLVDEFSGDLGRNRTGCLKGYGNAIVPELAAVFVRAVLEVLK